MCGFNPWGQPYGFDWSVDDSSKIYPMKQEKTRLESMFNIEVVKKRIANCPEGEIVILCGHWSINKPKYPEDADPETSDWDFLDFEELLDTTLIVTDYDDLAADPHGIYNQ